MQNLNKIIKRKNRRYPFFICRKTDYSPTEKTFHSAKSVQIGKKISYKYADGCPNQNYCRHLMSWRADAVPIAFVMVTNADFKLEMQIEREREIQITPMQYPR